MLNRLGWTTLDRWTRLSHAIELIGNGKKKITVREQTTPDGRERFIFLAPLIGEKKHLRAAIGLPSMEEFLFSE